MKIKGIDFEDGELTVCADYDRSEHAGAGECFQIIDIILNGDSILERLDIDQGYHYHNVEELAAELKINSNLINIIAM